MVYHFCIACMTDRQPAWQTPGSLIAMVHILMRPKNQLEEWLSNLSMSAFRLSGSQVRYAAPFLWNRLSDSFCNPRDAQFSCHLLHSTHLGSSSMRHSLSITLSLYPENFVFSWIFSTLVISPSPRDWLYGFWSVIQRLDLIVCDRLSWLIVNFWLHAKLCISYSTDLTRLDFSDEWSEEFCTGNDKSVLQACGRFYKICQY